MLQPLSVCDVALGLLLGGIACCEAAVHERAFGIDLSRCSRQFSAASRGVDSPTLPPLRLGLTVLWLRILRPRSSGDAPGCARLRNPRERPTPSPAQLAMYGRTRHTHYPEGMQTKRPLQRVVTKCQRTVAEGRDSAWPFGGQSSRRATPRRRSGGSLSQRTGDSATPSTAKCRPGVGSVTTSPPVTPSLTWARRAGPLRRRCHSLLGAPVLSFGRLLGASRAALGDGSPRSVVLGYRFRTILRRRARALRRCRNARGSTTLLLVRSSSPTPVRVCTSPMEALLSLSRVTAFPRRRSQPRV